MKFHFLDETDSDIRDVLKTTPWVGIAFSVFIGYIFFETLLSSSVSMRDGYSPIFFEVKTFSFDQHPVLFVAVTLLEAVIFGACLAYVYCRLAIKRRLVKEDRQ